MKTYRINSVMVGILYILGTIFGIASAIVGGEIVASSVKEKPLLNEELLLLVTEDSSRLIGASALVLLMGISLVMMVVFLYPIVKKDSEELAMGMLLFRGALEGVWYMMSTLTFVVLVILGKEYVGTGSNSVILESLGNAVYQFQDLLGSIGSFLFLIGATCLYISFYRTRLIPRWLTIWGLIGVVPYFLYVILQFFEIDNGIGFYLQMLLAPQEMVMALWLIIKGFNRDAINKLMTS